MSVDSSNPQDGWDCVEDALAEIGSGTRELQGIVTDLFDELGRMANELLLGELSQRRIEQQAEREAIEEQIKRLTALAAHLSEAMTKRVEVRLIE